MKSVILGFLLLVVALSVALAPAKHDHAISPSNDDSLSDNCSDHMHDYDSRYHSIVRDEEVRTLANQPLDVHAEHNGGIHISTWDNPNFSVKLCKQVASDRGDQGKQILSETRLVVEGTRISVSSPDHDEDYDLNTLLLIKAPRNAQISMEVKNGGISLDHFVGTADARAKNGGIALKRSSGKLTIHAQNGGVSIKDCGGDVTAEVENGGLSIVLPDRWDGKGLEAHTQNGGLMIGVPHNFNSSLEVTASNHVSIICKGEACNKGERTWDDDRRILRLGNGVPQIRATTVNGGIVIADRERDSI